MKVADDIYRLKVEMVQSSLALQDTAKLQRVKAALDETEPTPQVILDLIKRGQAESKAGLCRPIEEFLEEIKDL